MKCPCQGSDDMCPCQNRLRRIAVMTPVPIDDEMLARIDALTADLDEAQTELQDKEVSADYWHQESRIQYEAKQKARAERDALAEKLARAVMCLEFIGCEENEEGSLARKALAAIKEGGE